MIDLRSKLKIASFRNQSLQDILRSCLEAVEVITIEPYVSKLHNTKMTLWLNKGNLFPPQEQLYKRVHFYNRLSLENIIPSGFISSGNILTDITNLNLQGCDFTTGDIELIDGLITAKLDSLGYCREAASQGACTPTSFSIDTIPNETVHDGYDNFMGEDIWISYQKDNGSLITENFTSASYGALSDTFGQWLYGSGFVSGVDHSFNFEQGSPSVLSGRSLGRFREDCPKDLIFRLSPSVPSGSVDLVEYLGIVNKSAHACVVPGGMVDIG